MIKRNKYLIAKGMKIKALLKKQSAKMFQTNSLMTLSLPSSSITKVGNVLVADNLNPPPGLNSAYPPLNKNHAAVSLECQPACQPL